MGDTVSEQTSNSPGKSAEKSKASQEISHIVEKLAKLTPEQLAAVLKIIGD